MKNRIVHKLGPRLSDTLLSYAAAASAAGVGVLSLAVPAHAEVVYTPSNITLLYKVQIDLNQDGKNDFTIFHGTSPTGGNYYESWIDALAFGRNQIAATNSESYAAALHAGDEIGPNSPFKMKRPNLVMATCPFIGCTSPGGGKGPFTKAQHGYLGLKFTISGETHFGWARINMPTGPHSGVLTGYAYETIPNKPIRAGQTSGNEATAGTLDPSAFIEPATLGRLALGAPGVAAGKLQEGRKVGGRE